MVCAMMPDYCATIPAISRLWSVKLQQQHTCDQQWEACFWLQQSAALPAAAAWFGSSAILLQLAES